MKVNHYFEQGVVSIEFALILSVALAPLFWISIEAGRFYFQYNVAVKNVKTATRYLAGYSQFETNVANSVYEARAKNIVKCGQLIANACNKPSVSSLANVITTIRYTKNENLVINGNNSASVSYVTVEVTNFKLNYLSDTFNKALISVTAPIKATFRQAA